MARIDDSSGYFPKWARVPPEKNEACRWESVDGRWIVLVLDKAPGKVLVMDDRGRREIVDSYDGALALAKSWRT